VLDNALIKKNTKFFIIYEEIQMGSVAKSYMRKGFIIYAEMRKYSTLYDFANRSHLNFPIYEENLIFFFISVGDFQIERKNELERTKYIYMVSSTWRW
jgi:hypothetical protein